MKFTEDSGKKLINISSLQRKSDKVYKVQGLNFWGRKSDKVYKVQGLNFWGTLSCDIMGYKNSQLYEIQGFWE